MRSDTGLVVMGTGMHHGYESQESRVIRAGEHCHGFSSHNQIYAGILLAESYRLISLLSVIQIK